MKKHNVKIILTLVVLCCFIVLTAAAPAPPTDVEANDVPDDNGGQINITWNLSADDGAGGDNVTFYEIYRNESGSVHFTLIKNVTSGTEWYIDNSTDDDKTYRYIIRSIAGNESSNSSISNPAQSIDELEPKITNVANGTVTDSTAAITWDTDEPSDSLVKYGTSPLSYTYNKGNSSNVASHSITLTGLSANKTYYYVVNSTDAGGNSNQSTTEKNFTTNVDSTPPTVENPDYGSHQNNFPVTSSVNAIFSEEMNSSTINSNSFYVKNSSEMINGSVTYDNSTRTATFSPIKNFDYNIQYTVTITTEVKDLIGHNMDSNHTWTFTTVKNQGPELLNPKVDPTEGTTPVTFNFSVTYKDNENDSAEYVRVYINGTPFNMTTSDDDKPKDGKKYVYDVRISDVGSYDYYFTASDGNTVEKTDSEGIEVYSKTHFTGNRIWEEGMETDYYIWTPQSFSGFYYNLDTDEGGETLTINNIDRSLGRGDIEYKTEPIKVRFEQSAFGWYNVIGFMAERYFAGYENGTIGDASYSLLNEEVLSRVLIDNDESKMIRSGTPLVLEEGYDFRVTEYAASGDDVMVALFKDGEVVDETIISEGQTYKYKKDLGSADNIPIIAIRVETVFRGMETSTIKIDGIFQISDNYIEIGRGDEFGLMEIDDVSDTITLTNPDSVSLTKGKTFNLMGKINIEVGDDTTLRFAPAVDMSEPGTYRLRGTVTEEADYTWTPLNFEGLVYDMDSGYGKETMTVIRSGRNINNGNLTYSTQIINMNFECTDWKKYDSIGFMGEKYFAGYQANTIQNNGISLMEKTGRLGKILMDESDKHTLYVGNMLPLAEGYSLRIDEISRDGDSIMVALLKDGEEVDNTITNEGKTYVYTKEIEKEDIPIIAIYIAKIFRGMETNSVFIEGIFQISEDFRLVEEGDTYGEMRIETVTKDTITMENKNDITLGKDNTISIMGDIKFMVADSDKVRFYPYQNIEVEALQSLVIHAPTSVYENKEFNITVTSGNDEVEGAYITFGDIEIGKTDSNGELIYATAETGIFNVTASKSGYNSDSSRIEVIYQPKALDVRFPRVVDMNESFTITVTSEGSPVSGVSVMFGSQDLGTTPASGNITHIPDEIGTFTITASKTGYQEISKDIDISDPGAKLVFSNLMIEPKEVEPDQMVNITIDATNFGTLQEAETVTLLINDDEECALDVTLGPDETTTLEFAVNRSKPGTYEVVIGDRSDSFKVKGKGGIGAIGLTVLGVIGILCAGAVVYSIAQGTLTLETVTAKAQEIEQSIRHLIEK
jgi:S-layer protein (TIGR01567 family)